MDGRTTSRLMDLYVVIHYGPHIFQYLIEPMMPNCVHFGPTRDFVAPCGARYFRRLQLDNKGSTSCKKWASKTWT
jgi:hypothetical protein